MICWQLVTPTKPRDIHVASHISQIHVYQSALSRLSSNTDAFQRDLTIFRVPTFPCPPPRRGILFSLRRRRGRREEKLKGFPEWSGFSLAAISENMCSLGLAAVAASTDSTACRKFRRFLLALGSFETVFANWKCQVVLLPTGAHQVNKLWMTFRPTDLKEWRQADSGSVRHVVITSIVTESRSFAVPIKRVIFFNNSETKIRRNGRTFWVRGQRRAELHIQMISKTVSPTSIFSLSFEVISCLVKVVSNLEHLKF